MNDLDNSKHILPTVPVPQNGSKTISPDFVVCKIGNVTISFGKGAGCSLLE